MTAAPIATLEALLAKHHTGLTSDEVLDELDAALGAVPGAETSPLSAAEVRFLRDHGGTRAVEVHTDWSAGAERKSRSRIAVQELAQVLSATVTIKEAAAMLGIDRSRVSRRISGNALWAFDLRGSRRIPRWQFLGDGLVPGLETVVPAIPKDATPVAIESLMHTPQSDLDDQTPVEYLAAGGDPGAVAGLMADLSRW